jgi:hypothetical protein
MRHKEKTANQSENVDLIRDVEVLKVLHLDAFFAPFLSRRGPPHRAPQSLRQRFGEERAVSSFTPPAS